MTNNVKSEIAISFRFTRLDKFQAFTLVREIIGATYQEQVENKQYVGAIPLTSENFDLINDYVVRQRIELDDCDILLSAKLTELPGADKGDKVIPPKNNSIAIPEIVNRMLKYIDCQLTLTFY
ncbi:MAG: hypothetical protein ACSHW0_07985 [Thalassotalea sp.]